jgi:CheY-like chemotaxis protein
MGWDKIMQVQGKILTVDDDPNNITIVEELLEDNYDLKTATSGEQALEIAKDFRPDIILLDIMMPGMNGYEVCRRLREHYTSEHTKIIMVSARAMISERLEGYEVGADDYITKPFDGDEFLAKILLYMDLKRVKKMDRMWREATTKTIDELRIPVVVAKNIISKATANIFGEIKPHLHHQLEIANDCMDSIESIMSNFYDISDIHGPKVEFQRTLFSIQSVVLEVIDMLKPKAASRKTCMSTDMPAEELSVNADRQKIVKILENLIGGAIRGNHEGNSINVRVKSLEDKIGVDVEVTRTGIESSKADESFDRFDQLEKNVAPGRQGKGLALSVIQRLAELQGGRIYVRNRSEGGTVFSFEMPISTETETTIELALSGVGVNSGICEQPE